MHLVALKRRFALAARANQLNEFAVSLSDFVRFDGKVSVVGLTSSQESKGTKEYLWQS